MDYSRSSNIKARREHASNRKKIINKIGVIIFRAFIAVVLVGGFAAAGAGVGLYLGVIHNAPLVNVNIQPEIYTSIIYDSTGANEIDRLKGEENRIYITSDKMPKNLKNAFVAIEDERFFQHDGIDVQGMIRAAYTMVQTGFKRTEGASTITQQLIKNNVNKRSSNTFITKLQEQYMAVQYEKEVEKLYGSKEKAKEHILEVYINTINLGHGYYGVQTAAKNYFNKAVEDLTLSECAVIASITQNPSKNTPDTHPDKNMERSELVLNKMLELNMITKAQYDEAKNDNVYDRISTNVETTQENSSAHSYFIDALVGQLSDDLQTTLKIGVGEASNLIYNGGLQIWATQDAHMQQIVDNVMLDDSYYPPELFKVDIEYDITVTNSITNKQTTYVKKDTVGSYEDVQPRIDEWKREILTASDNYDDRTFVIPQPQVGLVVMDYYTGKVKAIAGGRGDKNDNRLFNRAVDSVRQPGSVFKILASYAPAIELGKIGPSTILVDEPFTYNGYTPQNWWGPNSYKGPQTVRAAIEQSMNILAIKNLINTGIEESYKILKRFHLHTLVDGEEIGGQWFTDKTAAMALGGLTRGITTLDMTAAFGAIANEGVYEKPIFYTKVLNHDGVPIIDNTDPKENPPEEILKKSTAYILTDMMRGVINSPNGTGRSAKFRTIDMPIAGKTGTTSDAKDLTFVGYTPYYVCGIWTGYDQPMKMDTPNQHFHLSIWRDVMEEIHKDLPVKDFEKPASVQMVYVCQDSGKLATDFCWNDPRGNRVVETPVTAGDAPTEYCDLHGAVTVDTSTGMRASAYCPNSVRKTLYGIVVQDEYITDPSYQIPASLYNGPVCTVHRKPAPDAPVENTWDNPDQQAGGQEQPANDQTGQSGGQEQPAAQTEQPVAAQTEQPVAQTEQPVAQTEQPVAVQTEQPAAQPENTAQPDVPPEFQNTDELPQGDQGQAPWDPITPEQPVDNAQPRSAAATEGTGQNADWVEPTANPPENSVSHIDDQNNPVIDEPASLDNFAP